ncbi:MAG: hypothetical protein ACRDHL_01260 [Candidatus Promineifilaceae bacterium]
MRAWKRTPTEPGRLRAVWLLLALLLLSGCALEGQTETPASGAGFAIAPEFAAFYDHYGGARLFGYPLAEPYTDPQTGRLVQYFQNTRLEYNLAAAQVLMAPLGEWALPPAEAQLPAPQAAGGPARFFPETGLALQDEFLAFYEAHRGDLLFGPPLSAQLDEGGRRVQYFRNVRLEWHPAAPPEYRLQVGPLGEAHYRAVGAYQDPGRSRPLDSAGVREAVLAANVRAPILYGGEQQVIFVDVSTADGGRPVAGVQVDLALSYAGRTEAVRMPDTDGAGHTQMALALADAEPGQRVQVLATAFAPGGQAIGQTSLSFTIWW